MGLTEKLFRGLQGKPAAPWRIVFFGSDRFSVPHLKVLHDLQTERLKNPSLVQSLDVITTNKSPVHKYAKKNELTIRPWPFEYNKQYDIGILASFGHMIPKKVIGHFPLGIINIHPSALPRFRGAAPLVHTILSGDQNTAITAMQIEPHRFDRGPILLQREYPVNCDVTINELTDVMAQHGAECLLEVLTDFSMDKCTSLQQKQDDHAPTAPKVKQDNYNLDFVNNSAEQIYRQYRAVGQDGLLSAWGDHNLKLHSMVSPSKMTNIDAALERDTAGHVMEPGQLVAFKKLLVICIKCKTGWAAFEEVTIRGKRIPAYAFYTGYVAQTRRQHEHYRQHPNELERFNSLANELDKHWGSQIS